MGENVRCPYRYESLEEGRGFRILVLQPAASFDEVVRCNLQLALPDDHPPFEALSYVWGDDWVSDEFILEGTSVTVTANLESALRHLRLTDETHLIWVDALCIDQGNLGERRRHVQYMHEIYARCTTDLLWLGDDADMLRKASAAISEFGTAVNALKDDPDAPKIGWQSRQDLLQLFAMSRVWKRVWIMQEISFAPQVLLVAGKNTMSWDVIEDFLEVNASIEKYGIPDAYHAPSSHDFANRSRLNRYLANPQILSHQRREIGTQAKEEGYKSPLMDVLARFRFTEATDPRDKIYALLGLASDVSDLQVDYSSSVQDVYIYCSKYIIEKMGNLDLICQGPWECTSPSWIPDYANAGESNILFAQRGIYNAGGGLPQPYNVDISPSGALRLKGHHIGTVAAVREPFYPANHLASHNYDSSSFFRLTSTSKLTLYWMPDDLLKAFIHDGDTHRSWLKRYLTNDEYDIARARLDGHDQTGRSSSSRAKRFEAYWRTLTQDCERFPVRRLKSADNPISASSNEVMRLSETFTSLLTTPHAVIPPESSSKSDPNARGERHTHDLGKVSDEIQRLLHRVMSKWAFGILHASLDPHLFDEAATINTNVNNKDHSSHDTTSPPPEIYSTLPHNAKPGDHIYAAPGAKVPLILHPVAITTTTDSTDETTMQNSTHGVSNRNQVTNPDETGVSVTDTDNASITTTNTQEPRKSQYIYIGPAHVHGCPQPSHRPGYQDIRNRLTHHSNPNKQHNRPAIHIARTHQLPCGRRTQNSRSQLR